MSKRKIIIAVALAALIALAGCGEDNGNPNAGKNLANDTGTNITNGHESYHFEVGATETNQLGLVKAQPPIKMDQSLERANLIRRYEYLNDRNNVHHVYGLSNDGKVLFYSVAQGKVSSVNSKLTNDVQIVRAKNCEWDAGNGAGGAEGSCFKTVESPQMDGSYGSNGDAIFWFTTDGQYMEYNGIYVVSEEPKNIQTAISLVDEVNEEESEDDTAQNSQG